MASITKGASYAPTSTWKQNLVNSIARSRKVRGGNYVQIATVDAENRPHNRTVVFRGFQVDENGKEAFKMITDARSQKVEQVKHSPYCEMVWWFGKTSEQYRVYGTLRLVGPDAQDSNSEKQNHIAIARKQQWGNLSDPAREQFYWDPPGIEFSSDTERQVKSLPKGGRCADTGKVLPPPPNFLLMLFYPQEVKYLRLTDNYAQIDKMCDQLGQKEIPDNTSQSSEANSGWVSIHVNP